MCLKPGIFLLFLFCQKTRKVKYLRLLSMTPSPTSSRYFSPVGMIGIKGEWGIVDNVRNIPNFENQGSFILEV